MSPPVDVPGLAEVGAAPPPDADEVALGGGGAPPLADADEPPNAEKMLEKMLGLAGAGPAPKNDELRVEALVCPPNADEFALGTAGGGSARLPDAEALAFGMPADFADAEGGGTVAEP